MVVTYFYSPSILCLIMSKRTLLYNVSLVLVVAGGMMVFDAFSNLVDGYKAAKVNEEAMTPIVKSHLGSGTSSNTEVTKIKMT